MDIDKKKMEQAFLNHDKDISAQKELIGYFFQMAKYHCQRLKVDYSIREDYIQDAVSLAYSKTGKYDPAKNSAAFSYFYKVIYMSILYSLRRDNNKKKRGITFSSFDLIEPTIDDDRYEALIPEEESDTLVNIDGNVMKRDVVVRAVKEAKKIYRKYKKSEDANTIPVDPDVLYFFNVIKQHDMK